MENVTIVESNRRPIMKIKTSILILLTVGSFPSAFADLEGAVMSRIHSESHDIARPAQVRRSESARHVANSGGAKVEPAAAPAAHPKAREVRDLKRIKNQKPDKAEHPGVRR